MSVFTPVELLALAPSDLRGLVELADGEQLGVKAAALGLDLTIPEHLSAFLAAFPEIQEVSYFADISAGEDGVRSNLTPPGRSPAGPAAGDHGTPGEAHSPFDGPEGLTAHIAAHRGTGRPFLAGTFALYAAPDGSVVMVTETDQAGVRRDVMPARLVKLALGFAANQGGGLLPRWLRRG